MASQVILWWCNVAFSTPFIKLSAVEVNNVTQAHAQQHGDISIE